MHDVYYAAVDDYSDAELDAALEKSLLPCVKSLGGLNGKRVMIKPNFLEWKGHEHPVCVAPELLVALCRFLKRGGAAEVAVIENPAVRTAPVIVEKMGIASELDALDVTVANCADYQLTDMAADSVYRKIEVAQEFRNYDLVIDFAKAKTHAMMTLTLAVKNLFGLVRGSERLGWHLAVGRDYGQFADMLLDIYSLVMPRISIIDAVVGMEGNGPGSGTPVKLGFIACANDALSLDASVAEKLGVPDLLVIKRAEMRGMETRFNDRGDIPDVRSIVLPDPPQMALEWGVYFPRRLREFLRRHMVAKPELDHDKCIGCGVCVKMCPPHSLKLVNGKAVFKLSECIRCFCCQEHCPRGAITSRKTALMRFADGFEKLVRKLNRG